MPKPIIKAAGGLVTNPAGELLMIYRRGKWDLPKGKLDEGETIEACAVREVQEETGLKHIILDTAAGTTYHEYFDRYKSADVIKETYWFAMHIEEEQELIPQAEEDILDIQWADEQALEECLKNTYPNIVEIIDKCRRKGG